MGSMAMMPKINKRNIVKNLVEAPKAGARTFWAKEMTLLKKLEAQYPIEFLNDLAAPEVPSLAVYFSPPMDQKLKTWYNEYCYKPRLKSPDKIDLGAEKIGSDVTIASKPKTIREFFNE